MSLQQHLYNYSTISEILENYIKELDENTALSEISDTITGKITYTDGTEELFTITLNFDDEGKLTTTYNCNIAYYPIAE